MIRVLRYWPSFVVGFALGYLGCMRMGWLDQLAMALVGAVLGLLVHVVLAAFFTTRVGAVAEQTFVQCLRTRVGGAFMVLLAVCMLATTMFTNHDESVPLADRIRTFLSYSTGLVTVVLVIVTVFLGTGAVSNDVAQKQIFILAVKPLARWQYILGRWLGVVLMDVMLLVVSGGVIYLIAQHMRTLPPTSAADHRAVETEVFTARKDQPGHDRRIQSRREEGRNRGRAGQARAHL